MISDENNVLLNEVGCISKDTEKDKEPTIIYKPEFKVPVQKMSQDLGPKILIGHKQHHTTHKF